LRQFETGQIDALANVIITEKRRKTMRYSIPHAALHGLTYTRPGEPPITRTEQFAGKSMVMLNGTLSQLDAENNQGWGAKMVVEESWAKVLQRVKNGEFDFALLTRQLSFEQPDELGLHRDFVDDIIYPFHIVVQPGDSDGLEQINAALARVQHAGVYDRLHDQWIGPIEPHPIRLSDLRPYYPTIAATLALIVVVVLWQRYNNFRLQRQTDALRESTDLLRMTGAMAQLGGWTMDLLSKKTNISDEVAVIYGIPKGSEIPVQDGIRFYAPEWREKITAVFEACAREGTPYDEELELINAQGQRLWVRTTGEPVRDQAGKIIKVQGTLQDITKRRQIEGHLRESEERFRRAVVNSPIPMLLHAEDGEIIWGSDSWYAISGYEPEELKTIGDWTERAYGDRKQPVLAEIETLYSLTGSKAEGDYTIRTKSGALRIWDFHSASLGQLPDGRRLAISMAMDITDKKEAERQAERDGDFLAAVLESINEGVVACDSSGVRTLFNQATREFHGLPEKPIPAEEWAAHYDLFLPDGETPMTTKDVPLFRALKGERVRDEEMVIVPKHGEPRRLLASGRVLSDASGKEIGAVVSMRDITERKKTEAALIRSRTQLRELAGRMVNAREDESSRIARTVHDVLGQQLTGIKMDLRLIERSLESAESAQVPPILDRVVSTRALVDDSIQTVQGIAASLRSPILDKIGLVAALRHELKLLATRAGLTCRYLGSADELPLYPDLATACFRIAQEALTNVARHAAASLVEVELTTDHHTLIMEIRDNGKGLKQDLATMPQSLGVLGMQERAHQVAGEFSIENRPEGGTLIRVQFPFHGAAGA